MKKELLKAVRLYYGLSQQEFAKKIGVHTSTIAMIEIGERNISDRVRIAIAKQFEITPELLDSLERASRLAQD